MDNREKDRMSQRDASTDTKDTTRKTEQERGNSGTGTEFGKNSGRSENLGDEGGGNMQKGNMQKKDQENMNQERGSEESRRPSGDRNFESGDKSEKIDKSEKDGNRSGNIGSTGERGENRSDRSKGSGEMGNH